MHQPLLLLASGARHCGVPVAEVERARAGEEVDVGVAVHVAHRRPSALLEGERDGARVGARAALQCRLFGQHPL